MHAQPGTVHRRGPSRACGVPRGARGSFCSRVLDHRPQVTARCASTTARWSSTRSPTAPCSRVPRPHHPGQRRCRAHARHHDPAARGHPHPVPGLAGLPRGRPRLAGRGPAVGHDPPHRHARAPGAHAGDGPSQGRGSEISTQPLPGPRPGPPFAVPVTFADVTDQVAAEQGRRVRGRGEPVGVISHALRSPLGTVDGLLALLARGAGRPAPRRPGATGCRPSARLSRAAHGRRWPSSTAGALDLMGCDLDLGALVRQRAVEARPEPSGAGCAWRCARRTMVRVDADRVAPGRGQPDLQRGRALALGGARCTSRCRATWTGPWCA